MIAALVWWRRPPAEDTGLSEQFFGAFRAGLRYARSSRELHVVLLRAAVFFLFASAVWRYCRWWRGACCKAPRASTA